MAVWQYALCSLADLKAYLKISGNEQDTFLEGLVDSASGAIETFCGRKLKSRTYTDEKYDGDGTMSVLILKQYPVSMVDSLYDDPKGVFGSNTLVDPNSYRLYGEAGIIKLISGVFSAGTQNIKVTYTAGYVTIPYELNLACKILAADYYFKAPAGKGRQGIKTERLAQGQGDISFQQKEIPPEVVALLRPYRRKTIGR